MTLDFFYFVVSEAVTEKEPQCNYYFLQVKGEPPNLNLIFNSQALLEKLYMNQVKIILIISYLVPFIQMAAPHKERSTPTEVIRSEEQKKETEWLYLTLTSFLETLATFDMKSTKEDIRQKMGK